MTNKWTLSETAFLPESAKAYEGLFTLGSGYMHIRGSLEEGLSDSPQNDTFLRMPANVTAETFKRTSAKWGTYVPGIFGPHPTLNNEMVNLPFFLDMRPEVDGEKLDMLNSTTRDYNRTLDMRSATLTRKLIWTPRSGAEITVTSEVFISAVRRNLCVQRMTFATNSPVRIKLSSGIDTDVRTSGYDHYAHVALSQESANGLTCRVTTDGGDEVTLLAQLTAADARWHYNNTDRAAELVSEFDIPAEGTLTVEKRTAVTTGRDLRPCTPQKTLAAASEASFEQLHAEHAADWKERWDACDVVIDGDPESQLAMRAALYHLLRAHVPDDPRVTIDAKGYAGDAYFGRYFWDTEMYLLPFYLYTAPDRAKTLVEFRTRSLEGAKANARRYGYDGARYAWESDNNGIEGCPNWQYCDHEVHVTAAVAYGLVHYARAACDDGFLRDTAATTFAETARYWCQRLDKRTGDENFSLLGVMGPDEYTPISSNNSYTNRMVSFALGTAAEVGRFGGASEAECKSFADAAAKLPILKREDGLVLQCEEFDDLADPRFDQLWKDRTKPFAAQVSQERLYRTKCLKQADVLMLMMLFSHEFTDDEVRLAWDYYLPVTTHDSSLSAGAHAIIAARLGMNEEAWAFWQKGSQTDLDVAHGGAADGVHIAGAGITWQMAVFAFAGMSTAMESDVLKLSPRLPDKWTRLAFPIVWKGCPVSIEIGKESMTITNGGEEDLAVEVYDVTSQIAAGESRAFACKRSES